MLDNKTLPNLYVAPNLRQNIILLPLIIALEKEVPKHDIPPRVAKPNPRAKRQDFIVEYYIYDERIKGFRRQRRYKRNKYEAEMLKNQIAAWISQNWYLNIEGKAVKLGDHTQKLKQKKLSEAIKIYIDIKKPEWEKGGYKSINSNLNVFSNWLKNSGKDKYVRDLSYTDMQEFFHYILEEKGCKPTTRNNYRVNIGNFLGFAIHNEWTETKVTSLFKKLAEDTPRNWHYSEEHQKLLGEHMKQYSPELRFACQFAFYTLARPTELTKLKIGDIAKIHENKIHLEAMYARKQKRERHITIPVQLEELISERGLLSLPPEWYIFSSDVTPGPRYRSQRYLSEKFKNKVLKPLNFPPQYTFYSWKHTGVVSCLKAGVPDIDIFEQGGWKTWSSFRRYINNLGVKENKSLRNNYATANL